MKYDETIYNDQITQETVWDEVIEAELAREEPAREDSAREVAERFTIDNDAKADWALRRISEDTREYERIRDLAEAQIKKIEERLAAAERRRDHRTAYLRALLSQFFLRVPHRRTKTQETYQLLSGKLVLKLSKAKPTYDSDRLIRYLKENGLQDYIKTEETAKWGELKKLLDLSGDRAVMKDTGEIVECIRLEQTPEEFKVEV